MNYKVYYPVVDDYRNADPGALGSDEFSYQVDNGTEVSNTALITITIAAPNVPPEAVASCWTTAQDTAFSGQLEASDSWIRKRRYFFFPL